MFPAAHRSSSGALTVSADSGLYTHVVTGRCQGWVGNEWGWVHTISRVTGHKTLKYIGNLDGNIHCIAALWIWVNCITKVCGRDHRHNLVISKIYHEYWVSSEEVKEGERERLVSTSSEYTNTHTHTHLSLILTPIYLVLTSVSKNNSKNY